MADWNWKIQEDGVKFEKGSNTIYVTIEIRKATWTTEKAIVKSYPFQGASETAATIVAALNTNATNEINDYLAKKATATALSADTATVHVITIA